MEKPMTVRRIIIFLVLTFVITFAAEAIIISNTIESSNTIELNLLLMVVMLIPAACVALTRLITKEYFRDAWILPNIKGHIKFYIIAWLLPSVLIVVGTAVYFLVFPSRFDSQMGYMTKLLADQGIEANAETQKSFVIISVVQSLILAPIFSIITSIGGEWGWRGYLVPKLCEKFSIIPTLLISGIIWGLWHAPLTLMGLNYGSDFAGHPYTSILAMCGFCIAFGTLLSYLSLKTRSCLPAAIAYGSLNGLATIGFFYIPGPEAIDNFLGPAPTGIIGGTGIIIAMVILAFLMVKDQRKGTLIAPPRISASLPEKTGNKL
ncbi:MAG: CPBP family intramembrane glutamic endopeptidase [Christensenellales bacterium]